MLAASPIPYHVQPLKLWSLEEGAPQAGGTGPTGCSFYGPTPNGFKQDGSPNFFYSIQWRGEPALAKLRAWRQAIVAGGVEWQLTEKHAQVDKLLELDQFRNSSLMVRKQQALRIERELRAMHA